MWLRGIITLGLAAGLCACDTALDLSAFDGAGGRGASDDLLAGDGGGEPRGRACPQEQLAGAETWLCTEKPVFRLSAQGETLFWLERQDNELASLHKAQLSDESSTELVELDRACGLAAHSDRVFVRTQSGTVLSLAAEDGTLQQELGGDDTGSYGDNCTIAADDTRVVWFDVLGGKLLQAAPKLSAATTVQEGVADVRYLALSPGGVLWVGRLTGSTDLALHYSRPGSSAAVMAQLSGEPCGVAFNGSEALITTLQGDMLRWDPEQPQSLPASVLSSVPQALCRLDTNGSHTAVTARNNATLFIVPPEMPQNMPQQLDVSGNHLADVALAGDTIVWAPHEWSALVRYSLP